MESKVEVRKPVRFFIPVKIMAGANREGFLRVLAELINHMPTNQQLRYGKIGNKEMADKLRDFVEVRKYYNVADKVNLRNSLLPYLPCFTRLDYDDVGIEVKAVAQEDGGPSDQELGAIFMELSYLLGEKKVKMTRLETQNKPVEQIKASIGSELNDTIAEAS